MKIIATALAVVVAALDLVAGTTDPAAGRTGRTEFKAAPKSAAAKPAERKPAAASKTLRLSDFSVSEHVSGPEAGLATFKAKLTVLYFWGYRCAPCMATLPKLVKLDHEYRSKGLVIVGIHAAAGDVKDIRATCVKHGVEFSIYRQYKSPGSYQVGALPKVLMFDESGNVMFDGHYSEITKQIEDRFKEK